MFEYTAKLNGWHIQQITKREFIIWGNVEGDKNNRFEDGMTIHTSGIKNRKVSEGDIVQTRNSKYLLGVKASLPTPPNKDQS